MAEPILNPHVGESVSKQYAASALGHKNITGAPRGIWTIARSCRSAIPGYRPGGSVTAELLSAFGVGETWSLLFGIECSPEAKVGKQ